MAEEIEKKIDGRHPWWPANEKWLAANRGRLARLPDGIGERITFLGNRAVVRGEGRSLIREALGLLAGAPADFTEEQARRGFRSLFIDYPRGEPPAPIGQQEALGLLASAGAAFGNQELIGQLRAALDADIDHGIHDLVDALGTADAAARTTRGHELERERAKGLGVLRAASAVNFEMARNVVSVLRSLHIAAFGDEGLHPPPGPLSRRIGPLPGAKDGPEDMAAVPDRVN
jgi:hypothetical protein